MDAPPWRRVLERCRAAALAAFLVAYPYLHAGLEGARLAYQLFFLLGACPYHNPFMHLIGQRLVRVTSQEMVSWAHVRVWAADFMRRATPGACQSFFTWHRRTAYCGAGWGQAP